MDELIEAVARVLRDHDAPEPPVEGIRPAGSQPTWAQYVDIATAVVALVRPEIERLTRERDEAREAATEWQSIAKLSSDGAHDILADRDEARAEIERLRAALREIVECEPERHAWSIEHARAALSR